MADAGKRKQTAGSDAGGDDHSLLDAAPDCIDPRHGYYEPTSQHLPDVLVGCAYWKY